MILYIERNAASEITAIELRERDGTVTTYSYKRDGWVDEVTPLLDRAREFGRYAPDDMPSGDHIIEAIMADING